MTDVKAGIAGARPPLDHADIDGKTYWFASWHPRARSSSSVAHLLPNYDEYLIAYRDRASFFDPAAMPKPDPDLIFAHVLPMEGRVVGLWRRQLSKGEIVVETTLATPLKRRGLAALRTAVERYARFTGFPVRVG